MKIVWPDLSHSCSDETIRQHFHEGSWSRGGILCTVIRREGIWPALTEITVFLLDRFLCLFISILFVFDYCKRTGFWTFFIKASKFHRRLVRRVLMAEGSNMAKLSLVRLEVTVADHKQYDSTNRTFSVWLQQVYYCWPQTFDILQLAPDVDVDLKRWDLPLIFGLHFRSFSRPWRWPFRICLQHGNFVHFILSVLFHFIKVLWMYWRGLIMAVLMAQWPIVARHCS